MRKVLVVDDNKDNRTTIELLLEDIEDIEVLSAENGLEALEICKKQKIDLIFMDIMMPVMDGIEATKKIKEIDKNIMIVAVSALDDEISKGVMLKEGCEDYIRKPIDRNVFKKRIKNYLELINLRNTKREPQDFAINPFSRDIYGRMTIFRLDNKKHISEFWDYFLSNQKKESDEISDCVRLIYAISSFVINSNKKCDLVFEENEEYLFLTMRGVGFINKNSLRNVILRNYLGERFVLDEDKLSFALKKRLYVPLVITPQKEQKDEVHKKEIEKIDESDKEILRKTHYEKISATEFLEITPFDVITKVENLESIEDELDLMILEFEKHYDYDKLQMICNGLDEYAEVIYEMVEFHHLGYAIRSLVNLLRSLPKDKIEAKNKVLQIFLVNILQDLSNWRKTIFIDKSANDIHYLDSSLLSSCLQAEMIFEDKELTTEENDIELF